MKNFVYLQSQSQSNATHIASVMRSAAGIFYAQRFAYIPAECKSRERLVMGRSVAFEDFDKRASWHPAFLCLHVKHSNTMKNGQKTAGETAKSITFKNEWFAFTEHLTNAQFGRLLRCLARFERGDINQQHVAELRKDAAVGVAYNFITSQIERRHA